MVRHHSFPNTIRNYIKNRLFFLQITIPAKIIIHSAQLEVLISKPVNYY